MAPSVAVEALTQEGQYCNVLDCDARLQPDRTSFTLPDAIRGVSINEQCKSRSVIDPSLCADKEANYFLISSAGAVTLWHRDFSGTSVFYALMKGCKTFYLIPPTTVNLNLFKDFLAQPQRDLFFGSNPHLDGGGCQKVTLLEGQAVCMPARMIHMVTTTGESIALGKLIQGTALHLHFFGCSRYLFSNFGNFKRCR